MATLATFFEKPIAVFRYRSQQSTNNREPRVSGAKARTAEAVADADPYALTGLPNDDVYFFCKRIDNTRLVRQAENHATGEWSAIGGACAAAVLVGIALIAPSVANTIDSYRLQDLKREQADLVTEQRKLDVIEERLINAPRLDAMAPQHNLVRPGADQVIRLQPKNEHAFAMNRRSFKSNSR